MFVNAVNDGGKIVARGCGNNDFLCACGDVSRRFFFRSIETGAFENYVDFVLFPRNVFSVFFGVDVDLFAVYDNCALGLFVACAFVDFVRNAVRVFISALRGIVFEKVREHFRVGKVVDSHYFVALSVEHLSESETTDTTESVNTNSDFCHFCVLQKMCFIIYFLLFKAILSPPSKKL